MFKRARWVQTCSLGRERRRDTPGLQQMQPYGKLF